MKVKSLTPAERLALIRKKLTHFDLEWQPTQYLDTGSPELNAVFGVGRLGIPYGKMIELSGPESNGKSTIATDLVALAQKDGAEAHWYDAENSLNERWLTKRGVDVSNLYIHTPYLGKFQKEKKLRMIYAQEQAAEVESAIRDSHERDNSRSRILVVDSVTALLTQAEAVAGLEGQKMNTNMALAQFLGKLLRRWVSMCQATNTLMIFINQLRVNPMQMFGNPEYTTGGKALKFYCHVRVKCRRAKGGKIMKANRALGIKGVLANFKNKVGGREGDQCAYKLYWNGKSLYFDSAELTKD